MIIIRHRINTIAELRRVPRHQGVEIDVRACAGELWLDHDPIAKPLRHDRFADYLTHFAHAMIVFNMKEAGHEQQTIDLASRHGIVNYFLLDVTAPYLYSAPRERGCRKIAVRYSEMEPIGGVQAQLGANGPLVDWVWIDTFTSLPLDAKSVALLQRFRTCLVCPERWNRPQDIATYIETMKNLDFTPDAVMTAASYADQWESAARAIGDR